MFGVGQRLDTSITYCEVTFSHTNMGFLQCGIRVHSKKTIHYPQGSQYRTIHDMYRLEA